MLEHVTELESSELKQLDEDEVLALPEGTICGKYRVVRLIAIGGMSQVFEAVHVELKKRVALKVLSPALRNDRLAQMRFATEAINAAGLVHTNILDVVDCGITNGLPYLVSNLLVGCDLATHFLLQGKLSPRDLVDILLPIASAIAFGHRRGVTHRDLKPENIFLHKEGAHVVPKVLDFGVSRMSGTPRITASISVVGTPHYMAPEQARAEKSVGPAADQYSMGVILYEGLTGHLPRDEAGTHALLYSVAYGSFPPPSKYVQIPTELERIVLKAMAAEPSERFGSMHELAVALAPYGSERRLRRVRGGVADASLLQPRYARPTRPARPSASNALPTVVATPVETVDMAVLIHLLRTRRGLLTALLAALFTFGAACLWLANPSSTVAPTRTLLPATASAQVDEPR